MNMILKTAAASALAIGLAAPAMAATFTNVSGVVTEGNSIEVLPYVADPGQAFADFNEIADDPTLEIVGDTSIHGAVTSLQVADLFTDAFKLDLGTGSYEITFTWTDTGSNGLDGGISVDGSLTNVASTDVVVLGTFTGMVDFVVDPTAGAITAREDAVWTMQIAAVPVPAAGLLLLTAIGGLGFARRRKAA